MMRISPIIEQQEYDSFVRAAQNDDDFPRSYDDWIKRRLKEKAIYLAQDVIVKEVVVPYEEFARYCKTTGREPSYKTLMDCAVIKYTVSNS